MSETINVHVAAAGSDVSSSTMTGRLGGDVEIDDCFKVLSVVVNKIPVFCLTEKKTITVLYKCTVTARNGKQIRRLGCICRRRGVDAEKAKKALVPYLIRMLKNNNDLK